MPSAAALAADVPLVVDLDGTLVTNDSLAESLLALARERPLALFALLGRLAGGRAAFKRALAELAPLDIETLPWNAPLLEHLQSERRRGRRIVLATGADQRVAERVARTLGLFDEVHASDGTTNLSGSAKRDRLLARFGEQGFDYIGNSARDLPVWATARRALLVAPSPRLARAAARAGPVERVFERPRPTLATWLGATRVHHWLKNLLLLVPLVAAQRLYEPRPLAAALAGLLAFGLAASGVYLLNDLLDLAADRRHPHKRQRALASGALPLTEALALLPLLWAAALAVAGALGTAFVGALAAYVATMAVYSLGVKDIAVVDATVLAGGYTLRIEAGALASGVAVAPRLLVCAVALFFGLALLKRYAELVTLRPGLAPGGQVRGYRVADAPLVAVLGIAANCVAVALLATYPLAEPTPAARSTVWFVCVLLLSWVARMWLMAHRGRIHDDPVAYALRDGPSRVLGLIVAASLLIPR